MYLQNHNDDDYPLIPRNTPVRGQYWGMERKEAIIWGINAGILIPIIFSKESNAGGIMWMLGSAAYLFMLKSIFSHRIGGRVMWQYAVDLYNTFKSPKHHFYYEQRGEVDGFTFVERYSSNWTEQEEKELGS